MMDKNPEFVLRTLALAMMIAAPLAAQAKSHEADHVTVELISEHTALVPG